MPQGDICRGNPSQGQPPLGKAVPEVRERALPERKGLQNDFSWASRFSLNSMNEVVMWAEPKRIIRPVCGNKDILIAVKIDGPVL
jgi:hypothetical protein